MSNRRPFLASLLALALVACSRDPNLARSYASAAHASSTAAARHLETGGAALQYGPAVKVGRGVARTYVVFDAKNGDIPLELGVALSEGAMHGLPARNPHAAH